MPETPGKRRRSWRGRIIFLGLIGVVVLVADLTANHDPSPPADMPASYGPGNTCYYVLVPGEAASLKQQGKCRQSDAVAQAPHAWVQSYYPFYDSSWYQKKVVPTANQGDYNTYMTVFGQGNAVEIAKLAPSARYVDDNGNVVSGTDAGVSDDGRGFSGGADGGDGGGHGGFDGGGHGGE